MCDAAAVCAHPEKLEGQPGHCSPEQIKECHGSKEGHPSSSEAASGTDDSEKK